jgi:hypothetical protein
MEKQFTLYAHSAYCQPFSIGRYNTILQAKKFLKFKIKKLMPNSDEFIFVIKEGAVIHYLVMGNLRSIRW